MKNFDTIRRTLLVIAFALTFGSCQDDFDAPTGQTGKSIAATMATDANFNLWTAVLKRIGLYESLNNNNSGEYTLFAPSDPAMTSFLAATYVGLPLPQPVTETSLLTFMDNLTTSSNPTLASFVTTMVPVVNYHMVSSKLTASLLTGNQTFATLNGARLSISRSGSTVVLNGNTAANGATVTSFDLLASNGVAHTVDRVMGVIATANVLTSMGVTVAYTTNPATVTSPAADVSDADFDLLAIMIRYTGQATTILPNATPLPDFTIFQPNDGLVRAYLDAISTTVQTEIQWGAYIASLTSATPPATPNPTLAQLTTLVQYHVVPGRFLTTDFTNGQILTPLTTSPTFLVGIAPVPPAPGPYTFNLSDANANPPDAVISGPNIQTNSGILHTINQVLRPN